MNMDIKEKADREKMATWLHRHIETMTIEPGEVLVLSTDQRLSSVQVDRVCADLHRIFDTDQKIIVLDGGMKIGKLLHVSPVEDDPGEVK